MTDTDTVTLPRAEYEALLEELEDLRDILALQEIDRKIERGETEYLPIEMVDRLLAGENTVLVWREYRGMSPEHLATAAGIGVPDLAEIETGRTHGPEDVLTRIAEALHVDLDDLLMVPRSDD